METIGERISQIISHNCESKAEFARILGEKPNTISNWIARGVGATIAKRITTAFHDVNLAWLLTGEGPMLKTKTEPTDNQTITKIKPNFNQDETKTEPINILNDKAVPCYESTEGSCGIKTDELELRARILNGMFEYLMSKGKVHKQKDFADIVGITPGNMSNALSGNPKYCTKPLLLRVNSAFGNIFCAEWLLTGEGPILKTETKAEPNNNQTETKIKPTDNQTITKIKPNFNQDETKTEPINILNDKAVPCYESTEGSCGIITMYNDFKEVPTYYIDFPPFNDCDAYITVYGDSMFPQYCAGELIAIKKINNYDAILWGEAHLVVTNSNANDLRTVKLLFQSDDESKLVLRASNPSFKGDTVISKADILNIFIVKGKIKRNQI